MKLQQIKTELFTRVSETTFGFRFEVFRVDGKVFKGKLTLNMLENGSINFTCFDCVNLTPEQLTEITRVSNLMKEKTE
jgi:hypothetical protein